MIRKLVLDRDTTLTNPGFKVVILHDVEGVCFVADRSPLTILGDLVTNSDKRRSPAHEIVISADVEVDCGEFTLFTNGMQLRKSRR